MNEKDISPILESTILDISLASAMPVNIDGTDLLRAAASANSFAYLTMNMPPRDLREVYYIIPSLLILMAADANSPCCAKCAFSLRNVMQSRVCITKFNEEDGVVVVGNILDFLLSRSQNIDLKAISTQRTVIEHCSVIYREVARYFPWKIVDVGGLRHCVLMLRYGDTVLQTSSAGALAVMSKDLQICKHMFSNGAIKPLLNVSDSEITNEACMLAGLGCLVQMCKIAEIGVRVVRQGALPLLEKGLHKDTGLSIRLIREKALYALAWLTRIRSDEVGGMPDIGTPEILKGMKRELSSGTLPAQSTVTQMLLNLHNKYAKEEAFLMNIRSLILDHVKHGPWRSRWLSAKAFCVLFRTDEHKWYFSQNGLIEALFDMIDIKNQDLQEVTMVSFLALASHPDIPPLFIEMGGCDVAAYMLSSSDEIVRELAVVLLKGLMLYDSEIVDAAIPQKLKFLFSTDSIPKRYGGEYEGLIEEYLQRIVENRRDQHYLLAQFQPDEIAALDISDAQLDSYQNTFMELDLNCGGVLHMDELKMLMVMMGEELDEEELKEILAKYTSDEDNPCMDFREFVVMMEGWSTQFGTGMTKVINEGLMRGAVGKARRQLKRFNDRKETDKAAIAAIKAKKQEKAEEIKNLAMEHFDHEKLGVQRKQIQQQRALANERKREQQLN